jgi:hypothetical protein
MTAREKRSANADLKSFSQAVVGGLVHIRLPE